MGAFCLFCGQKICLHGKFKELPWEDVRQTPPLFKARGDGKKATTWALDIWSSTSTMHHLLRQQAGRRACWLAGGDTNKFITATGRGTGRGGVGGSPGVDTR